MSNFTNCSDGDEPPSRHPTHATRSSTSEIPSIFHQSLRCSDDKVDVAGLIGRDTSAAPDDDCGLTLVQYGAAACFCYGTNWLWPRWPWTDTAPVQPCRGPLPHKEGGQRAITSYENMPQYASYPSLMPSEQFQIQRVISMSQVDKVGKT